MIFFIYTDTQDHAIYHVLIHLFFLPPMPEERRKTMWSELESNPGPLASQATTLTTRPCLLWQMSELNDTVEHQFHFGLWRCYHPQVGHSLTHSACPSWFIERLSISCEPCNIDIRAHTYSFKSHLTYFLFQNTWIALIFSKTLPEPFFKWERLFPWI